MKSKGRLQLVIVLVLAFLLLTGCRDVQQKDNISYRQINMQEAVKMMEEEKDYIILDVRTKEEYVEKHIPGAILIPNETIGNEHPEGLPNKDQLIMAYCRSGNRSKQASQKLANLGYTNIVEFGGIKDWQGDVKTGEEP